jgi:CspA family cold shock protein
MVDGPCAESVSVTSGKILRFDRTRGYGFIAPNGGGPDVFFHVNALSPGSEDKKAFSAGRTVEFEVVNSDRGPKAFAVRVIGDGAPQQVAHPVRESPFAPTPTSGDRSVDDDGMCDVLTSSEFSMELTELFLKTVPELTGAQIARLRGGVLAIAGKHGWVEE